MRPVHLAIFFSAILIFSGCDLGAIGKTNALTKKYMEDLSRKDFKIMYEMLNETTKKNYSQESFASLHRMLFKEFGDIKSYKKDTFHLTFDQPAKGAKYAVAYNLACERGRVDYELIILYENGKCTIISYGFKQDKTKMSIAEARREEEEAEKRAAKNKRL